MKEINGSYISAFYEIKETLDAYLLKVKKVLGIYIIENVIAYLNSFEAWNRKIVTAKKITSYEQKAWADLTSAFFGEQEGNVSLEYVPINSQTYCSLYQQATGDLVEQRRGRYAPRTPQWHKRESSLEVTRFHITGMLPEEFFNGPQIENVAKDSKPIFFCHMWEKYDLYKYLADRERDSGSARNGYTERRLILVRDGDAVPSPAYGSLSSLSKLRGQANLMIHPSQLHITNSIKTECPGAAKRLFRECHVAQQHEYLKHIEDIIVSTDSDYLYMPIHDPAECDGTPDGCEKSSEWTNMLTYYIESFHSSRTDAIFTEIDSVRWSKIENRGHFIKRCFKPGWVPEIVLYGNASANDWYFGYLGHYKPYTRDMELRFLSKSDTQFLYNEVLQLLAVNERNGFHYLHDLIPPNAQAKTCASLKYQHTGRPFG